MTSSSSRIFRTYETKPPTFLTRLWKGMSGLNLTKESSNDKSKNDQEDAHEYRTSSLFSPISKMTFTSHDVVMEGYLTKMGNPLSSKRVVFSTKNPVYCILRTDTFTLSYYKRPYELIWVGELPLSSSDILYSSEEDFAKKVWTFEIIQNKNVRTKWKTTDARSYHAWMDAIQSVLNHLKEKGTEVGEKTEDNQEEDHLETKYKVLPLISSSPQKQYRTFTAHGQSFILDSKYTMGLGIGIGAYGAVVSGTIVATREEVAIKKISEIFDDLVDAKRILREIRLLGHFHHPNITKLVDVPAPPSPESFNDIYIITDLMETDLHQVIYSMQPMSVRCFLSFFFFENYLNFFEFLGGSY